MPVTERVPPETALERARGALGDLPQDIDLNHGQLDISCGRDDYVEIVKRLKETEGLRCEFFTFLAGIDRSEFGQDEEGGGEGGSEDEDRPQLEVLVHLYSPDHVVHANVHVPLSFEDAKLPTITHLFAGANWHEREAHEMFGIDFDGHPALVNLYLPEDFEGHPLLKSFRLPTRLVKLWPGAKDPAEAASGGRG